MILATELGDETFIIAAVMSMRHPKFVVFLGGFVVGGFSQETPWHAMPGCIHVFLRGGFKYLFMFTPTWGNDPI